MELEKILAMAVAVIAEENCLEPDRVIVYHTAFTQTSSAHISK